MDWPRGDGDGRGKNCGEWRSRYGARADSDTTGIGVELVLFAIGTGPRQRALVAAKWCGTIFSNFHTIEIMNFHSISLGAVLLLSGATPLISRALAQGKPPMTISTQHPELLQQRIMDAYKAGQKKIVIPAGVYRISESKQGSNLEFRDLKNFEIDATGATFLMEDNSKTGVYFGNCQNVTFRGATVRNATIPFTQGAVAALADDRKSFELQIDDGYPVTLDDAKKFDARTTYYIFDRVTRRLKNNTYDYGSAGVERMGERRFLVKFDNPFGKEIEVGDLTSMRGRGGTGVHVDSCTKMNIEDVSAEFSGGFGWFETGGGSNHYNRISAKPGPLPIGATASPLMSENADGFHSAGAKVGPTIQNSMFTRMPDDGIAIHGEYQMVQQVEGNTLVCMRLWGGAPYAIGDHLTWVRKNGVPGGEAVVTAIKTLTDGLMAPIETEFPHFRDNKFFFELTLDKALAAQEGDVVSNLDQTGDGYVLRNNTILDHRARGLLLKARDGLVENNLVDGSSIAGLVMGPELWWGEGNYARNVTIRGNTFAHCGTTTTGPWNAQAGVLTLLGTGDAPDARGHRNITIENNTFANNDGVNVVLDGVEGAVFRDNKFLNAQQVENRRGADHYNIGALVDVGRAKNLTFAGNVIQRLGAANTAIAVAGKNASDITGLQSGFRVNGVKAVAQIPNPFDFQYADNEGVLRREVRDPAIIKEGDTYYMTFTMWPFANREDKRMNLPNHGSSPGIQLFSSKDLKTWKPENWLVKSADLPADSPYKHRFWAPEIHKMNGHFYLIFTADNWSKPEYNPAGNWGAAGYAFVGVADTITGPYRNITYIKDGACDTTLFADKDGATWAVMPKYDIFIRKIDLTNLNKGEVKWLGPETKIVSCDSAGTLLGQKPNYLEGPWVERIGDKYVLFHAETFDNSYWTGVATADSPLGPWTKDARGKVFEGGHLAVFDGPDGRKWLSYRREQNAPQRGTPAASPIDMDAQGRVIVDAPELTK